MPSRGGGKKKRMGRPRGSGAKPAAKVRRHRVTIMLNDAEMKHLRRRAEKGEQPLATIAYSLFMEAMSKR